MKSNIITIIMFFCGIPILLCHAYADVITPPDTIDQNYDIHYRVVQYDNLSSYQNTNNPIPQTNVEVEENKIFDKISQGNTDSLRNKEIPNSALKESPLNLPLAAEDIVLETNDAESRRQFRDKVGNTSVGSFLDSFKDDPLMNTIYFTSKDLTFNYKKTVANVLQLGFDMEPAGYEDRAFEIQSQQVSETPLTQSEKEIVTREAANIFNLISEYYSNVIYIFLGMMIALYLFIRYILNKYI